MIEAADNSPDKVFDSAVPNVRQGYTGVQLARSEPPAETQLWSPAAASPDEAVARTAVMKTG